MKEDLTLNQQTLYYAFSNDIERDTVICDSCGKDADYKSYERVEGGSINSYSCTNCSHCGYSDCNDSECSCCVDDTDHDELDLKYNTEWLFEFYHDCLFTNDNFPLKKLNPLNWFIFKSMLVLQKENLKRFNLTHHDVEHFRSKLVEQWKEA